MRALIADDDRGTAAILAKALERWLIQFIVAHEGDTAWSTLASDQPPSLACLT
jgi:DNA-binding response OmpR family regulator